MSHNLIRVLVSVLILASTSFANAQVPYYGGEMSTPTEDVSRFWVPSYRHPVRYSRDIRSARSLGDNRSVRFPRSTRFRGDEGCVEIKYIIAADGRAHNIEVVAEYPDGVYVDIVLDTIRQYKWQATAENVDRVAVVSNARFIFHHPSMHPFHEDAVCDWPDRPARATPKSCRNSKKSKLLKVCD